jgi:hypothetical protein
MITDEAIRQRSYTIWERDGRPDGKAAEHWFRAKAELELERATAQFGATDWTIIVMPRVPISCPPTRVMAQRVMKSSQAIAA